MIAKDQRCYGCHRKENKLSSARAWISAQFLVNKLMWVLCRSLKSAPRAAVASTETGPDMFALELARENVCSTCYPGASTELGLCRLGQEKNRSLLGPPNKCRYFFRTSSKQVPTLVTLPNTDLSSNIRTYRGSIDHRSLPFFYRGRLTQSNDLSTERLIERVY